MRYKTRDRPGEKLKKYIIFSTVFLIIIIIVYNYITPDIRYSLSPLHNAKIFESVSNVLISNPEKPVYYAEVRGNPGIIYESTDLGKKWKGIRLFNRALMPVVHPLYPGLFIATEDH